MLPIPSVHGVILRFFNAVALLTLLLLPPVAARADGLRLLALGDSLTAGYGLAETESFTVQLEAALLARGYDVQVINSGVRSEEHTSELQSLMRISYAVFCLKK